MTTYVRHSSDVKVLQPGEAATDELRVQQATDLDAMATEDESVEWSEDAGASQTVATLMLPPPGPEPRRAPRLCRRHAQLHPWHGLVEQQPLGSIQRVGRPVCDDSSIDWHATLPLQISNA